MLKGLVGWRICSCGGGGDGFVFLLDVVEEVAADVAAFGVVGEPRGELGDFGEIGGADALEEGVGKLLGVFGGADLAFVRFGEDEVERDVEAFAFERFPFSLVEPDPASHGTVFDLEGQAVADPVAGEQAAGFGAEEGAGSFDFLNDQAWRRGRRFW